MKTCTKCLNEKPLTEFHKKSAGSDGLKSQCKQCIRAINAADRALNKDKRKATESVWRSRNRERIRETYLAYYAKKKTDYARRQNIYTSNFPNRKAATTAVHNALRRGAIERFPCWVCGSSNSVAHHANYDAPLDVVWLCQSHHRQLHNECGDKVQADAAERGVYLEELPA